MMKPYGGAIEAWQVGPDIGNVRNNRPELLDRFALVQAADDSRFDPARTLQTGCAREATAGPREQESCLDRSCDTRDHR
jgi:hypothetical protein